MIKKVATRVALTVILAAAGFSLMQLRATARPVSACFVGTPCTATTFCGRGCFCLIAEGQTAGACEPNTIPQAAKPNSAR